MRPLYAATSREMAETTVEQRQVQADSLAALESSLPDGASGRTGRPPPIILTSAANFNQLHKQLQTVVKHSFEFRTTLNGTRVTTRDMVDYLAVKGPFDSTSMS
jgi:hypothetical protein